MIIQPPHRHQTRAQTCAAATRRLRDALAQFCRADGALELAWSTGRGDAAALQAAADDARAALASAYTPCYAAFIAAPDTAAAHVAASVLSEAERLARNSGIVLVRPGGEVADV